MSKLQRSDTSEQKPEPRYARDVRMDRADRAVFAHLLAAVAIFVIGAITGALRSPLLTALVFAAPAWTAIYGVAIGLKISRHMVWQLMGNAITRWVPLFYALVAGLIGGGLDAIAHRWP